MATIEKRTIKIEMPDGKVKKEVKYRVKVRLKGFPPETATFQLKSNAVEWARQIEADMKAGRYFGKSKRHTLAELLDLYEASELPKLKGSKHVKRKLTWWRNKAGFRPLSQLTPDVIVEARDDLKNTPKQKGGGVRSGADVNRYLAALSSVCIYGIKEPRWLKTNPCTDVSRFKESKGRTRFLSEHELPLLLQACRESKSNDLYLAVLISLTTGGRQSEVLGLRWSQIDLDNRIAILGDTKNGDARAMPLSGEAHSLLLKRKKVRHLFDDRVFPPAKRAKKAPFVNLRKPWVTALAQARIKDFRWHDLRHTTASYLTMEKSNALEIARLLGHRSLTTTLKYAHLLNEHIVSLGDKLAERFDVK